MNINPLTVYLTNKCTSKCFYCYRNILHVKEYKEVNVVSLKRFLTHLPNLNQIRLSGGEPSLYSELKGLVFFLNERNYFIDLLSNGSLVTLNGEIIDKISKVSLSLDSCDEKINNRHRGDGDAFERYHEALKYLHKINFKNIQVQITLGKSNFKQLEETLHHIIEVNGIKIIKISNIVFDEMEKSALFLADEDFAAIYETVQAVREKYHFAVSVQTSFLPQKSFLLLHDSLSSLNSYFINEHNDLYWSISEDSFFKIGNIKNSTFDEIAETLLQKKPVFEKYCDYVYSKIVESSVSYINPFEMIYQNQLIQPFLTNEKF